MLFKLFDVNRDGYVSMSSVLTQHLTASCRHITNEELSIIFSFGDKKDVPDVAQLFAESDANKDGLLSAFSSIMPPHSVYTH